MTGLFPDDPNPGGAWLSDDRRYRFTLWRNLAASGPQVLFIGVNPSTADADAEDATTRLWRTIATALGASRYVAINVFAWRATDVNELANVPEPVGGDLQIQAIYREFQDADIIVPCWGARGKIPKRLHGQVDAMREAVGIARTRMLKRVQVIGLTKSGDPKHPLYQDLSQPLVDWAA